MKFLKLFLILFLSGCGVTGNDAKIYPGFFGQKVVGNEAYVSVGNVWSEMDALPLAEEHCKKYGKIAVFKNFQGIVARFDCTIPDKNTSVPKDEEYSEDKTN
jgi:hypothetical protein